MSLLNKASLIQIPSGYKDGTLYSAKPTNGDGDFTFSRGSNLAATRTNSEGLIEKGRENLLLQSNTFDTTWITSNASVTSGQSGYDGSSDAWLFETTVAGATVQQAFTSTGVLTYSVYAKAGSVNGIRLRIDATSDANGYYDLVNGTIFLSEGIDASISDVGNGWYKCSLSQNVSGAVKIQFFTTDGTTSYDNGNIYIQDAQLEQGLVATDYIETTTTTAQAGILEDMPRLDYSGGATCGSLILEPQRTNNIPQSEYFGSGSGWSLLNNVTLGDFVLSPEGKMNATELVFDGTFGGRIERTIGGLTAAADYSVSIYARVASGTQDVVFGATADETFTLTTDWQRLTRTEAENDANAFPRFRCDDAATIEIFGFQHEAGSYHTSYIPTYGAISTRSEDSCSKTGISSLIGQSEGTMYWEVDFGENDSSEYPAVFIYDGTSSNRILIQRRGNNQLLQYQVNAGGSNQVDEFSTSTVGAGKVKIAIAYKTNDFVLYLNGNQEASDTSGNTFSGAISQISFQNLRHDRTSSLILFPTRLTNDELADLTTL